MWVCHCKGVTDRQIRSAINAGARTPVAIGAHGRAGRRYPGRLDSAPFIVVALTVSAALLLIEVALPTFGVAGIGGFTLLGVGIVGLAHGDEPWWPLALIAVAVCLWAVLIARGS